MAPAAYPNLDLFIDRGAAARAALSVAEEIRDAHLG
jgi:hypothetical protein